MKKIITLITILSAIVIGSDAQNLLSKVPSAATFVVKYSGDNLSNKLPVKKLDSYKFVKENLYKALKVDSLTSLEGTGINFEQDAYQYVTMEDSSVHFVSLFALENFQQFLTLIQANYHAEMKPEKRNGYEFLGLSDGMYVGWNDKQAVLVYANYMNRQSYYDYKYSSPDSDSAAAVVVDTTVVAEVPAPVEETEVAPPPPPAKAKGKKPSQGKRSPAKKTPGKKAKKGKPPVVKDEEVIVEAPIEDNGYHYDTTGQAAQEAWEKEQNKIIAARQKRTADSVINSVFNGNGSSIETEVSYNKVVNADANVSVWLNYDNLIYQYWNYLFGLKRYTRRYFDTELATKGLGGKESNGFRSGMNLYFDKDKMRIEQKMFSPDAGLSSLGREIYNSKQSNELAGYVNPGNIGYLSASINTEAMANYYYKLIRQYLTNTPYTREYSEVIDVYMDMLEIIIDEKAIAEVMPGNMMLVLHDMKTKMVTYTDYVYDDNFKSTEVKKTKEELSPNFTFVMQTKREAFLKKIANLPVKFAEKEHFNYKEKGGYYELAFDADKYPISSLYFMVKDGKAIITTSKEVVEMTLAGRGYTLDEITKKSILNNNMSIRIDTKKLVQQIATQVNSETGKKISKYLEDNMGDVMMEGGIKDGMMQATTSMSITGNNTNSLEFFFNMIDEINSIMEKDKEERTKKID